MEISALIVDDEENSVEMLKRQVPWDRFSIKHVYGAGSAAQARAIMETHSVQLLLCDIEMPGESGLEFIEWIREEKDLEQCNLECVILTCYPEYGFMRKAMQLGCSDYLLKPVDYEELYQVMEKAVRVIRENHAALEKKRPGEKEGEPQPAKDGSPKYWEGSSGRELVYQKMLPYIREKLTTHLSVTEIAACAALNPQYAMRLFKRVTGMSILEYVTSQRIELAKKLLETTSYQNEIIAEKVGYVSANYFIRQFKRTCGMTPREYRKTAACGVSAAAFPEKSHD